MYILIFIVVLFVLVLVHEWGHFFVAKKIGMRVDEFGIGFPPRIMGIKKGETLYSVNALPLGGFVRIFGEEALEDESQGEGPTSYENDRSFNRRPKWAQILVLVAGIGANIIFAWLLFTLALSTGVLTSVSPEEASPAAELHILDVLPGSPAAKAGIPAGAIVSGLASRGETVAPRTPEEFSTFVGRSGGSPVAVSYTYNGTDAHVEIVPETGVLESEPGKAAVGVSLGLAEMRALPLHIALAEGFMMTATGVRDIAQGLFSLIASAIGGQADIEQVRGPVGIAVLVRDASSMGFSALLIFTAFISLSLAVINIFPFPALDGGRLLFVIIEAIKGSPIPAKVAYYTNTAGFAVLVLLMIAITYHDIARLV
ncbi:site-2 protease family protein [Candidatus Kaiserbacteria bacterium]|nr:site-2 protease family protein [Candidatus Kaiserbacteria bacterium]